NVSALRHPEDVRHMVLARALAHFNAARVNALLLYQVGLGIHRTLGRQVHGVTLLTLAFHRPLLAIGVTHNHELGVGIVLQRAGIVIQDRLGFVVHAPRDVLLVRALYELNRRPRTHLRRWRRYLNVQCAGAGTGQVAGVSCGYSDVDRAGLQAGRVQGRRRTRAADGTNRGLVRVTSDFRVVGAGRAGG